MTQGIMAERHVSSEKLNRLADWSMRKPVIAVMGEFSSGKSTLMNLLLGRSILPTQVTATRMPPVWLKHGDAEPYRVDGSGKRHPVDLRNVDAIPLDDTRYIGLFAEADLLRRCDLIDTPGISDPNIKVKFWIKTVGYANAVMWCTHSGQAWRESERSMWETLPKRLRETSILLVTRKDKIRTEEDVKRIDRRLEREASGLFNARIFVSLTNAIHARQMQDDTLWASSGGKQFADMLDQVIEGIYIQRSFTMSRYVVGVPQDHAAHEEAKPKTPQTKNQAVVPVHAPAESLGRLLLQVRAHDEATNPIDAVATAEDRSARSHTDADGPTPVAHFADALPQANSDTGASPKAEDDARPRAPTTLATYRLNPPSPTDANERNLAEYRLPDPKLQKLATDTADSTEPSALDSANKSPPMESNEPLEGVSEGEFALIQEIWQHVCEHYEMSRAPHLDAAFRALVGHPAFDVQP